MIDKNKLIEMSEKDYTLVPNKVLRMGLNYKHISVFYYLMHCEENYHPSVIEVSKCLKMNKDVVCRTLKELVGVRVLRKVKASSIGITARYAVNHPSVWKEKV